MTEHPTYCIVSLNDFLNIPGDRLAVCLEEFGAWVEINRRMRTLMATLAPENTPLDSILKAEEFTWIDDGALNVTMHLTAEGKPLVDAHWPDDDSEASVTIHKPESPDA